MPGLDTFFSLFDSFFVLFFLFMRRSFGTGVDVGALNNNRQQTTFILSSKLAFMRYSIGKGQEGRCTRAFWFYDSCLLYELMVLGRRAV